MAVSCGKDNDERETLSTNLEVICFPSQGGSYDLSLNTDSPWHTISLHDWVTVTPESGNGNAIVTIRVDTWDNQDGETARGAKIIFLDDSDTLVTYIGQLNDDNQYRPDEPEFDRDRYVPNTLTLPDGNSATVPAQGGDFSISIAADCSWWVECDASWLSITPANGRLTGDLTVSAQEWTNDGNETSRTAEIRICYYDSSFATEPTYRLFTVTQTSGN